MNFWYHVCLWGLISQTNNLMEKGWTLGTNMCFVCYLLLKEANIHINLICFDLKVPMKWNFSFFLMKDHKKTGRQPFTVSQYYICFWSYIALKMLKSRQKVWTQNMWYLWRHIHWTNIHWILKWPYLWIYQSEPTETFQTKSEGNSVNSCFKIFIVLETFSVTVPF